MVKLLVSKGRREFSVLVKLESFNPTGSTKDRTAFGLVRAMHRESPLTWGTVVVESTSGNLGLAMSRILRPMGCRFIAVVDPNATETIRAALESSGAEVLLVTEPDREGGYLLNRLRLVQKLCAEHPEYRWSNQYGNPANPRIHEETTGPELAKQAGPTLDAVYVAVSTGGTLAGIARYLRAAKPEVRLVAVDAEGSVAVAGRAGRRLLSGIGASRPSSFLIRSHYDVVRHIADAPSFAACRILREDTGVAIGGSSGSVLCACLADLSGPQAPQTPVCVFPDGGGNYMRSFYDDAWLRERGMLDRVREAERRLRAELVSFRFASNTLEDLVEHPG